MTPHRFRLLASRAALAAVLSVGAIACGDDDDDDDTGASAEDGGTDEQAAAGGACESIVEFNATVMDVNTEGATEEEMASTGEELGALWAPVDENAPDEVSDEAGEISEALSDLAAGDPEKFDSDEIFETYTAVLGATVADCGFETVSATAVDYAFEGLPETVSAGTVALELENASEAELHEIVLFKKADGETRSAEEIMNDPASQEEGPGEFAGAAFADTGATSTGLAELTAGDYIAVCFIPVGSTDMSEEDDPEEGEGGPPHFTQGMLAEFTVE